MVMKAIVHEPTDNNVDISDNIIWDALIDIRPKRRQRLGTFKVIVYGRRVPIKIRRKTHFMYGRTYSDPKWIAIAQTPQEVLAKCKVRLERIFEHCSATANFSLWTQLTHEVI